MELLWYALGATLTGLIGLYIAKEKNRSQTEGFLFGFFLSIIGVIIVALLPTKKKKQKKAKELTEEQKANIIEVRKKANKQQKTTLKIALALGIAFIIYVIFWTSTH